MEAQTLFAFNSSNPEEMSFPAGVTLKIIDESDKDWFKAELNGCEGYIPSNYITYDKPSWYMKVSKLESAAILTEKNQRGGFKHPDGAFIVRPSENQHGERSLSVRIGADVQHFRILRSQTRDQYYLWNDGAHFFSVNQLVDYYHTQSVSKAGNARLRDMSIVKVSANFDFNARTNEELTIFHGETIVVTNMDNPDWMEGQVERDGAMHKGIFPASYVTILQ